MTELLQLDVIQSPVVTDPATGNFLFEQDYLWECVAALKEPMPKPDTPTSTICAAPFVEHLATKPDCERWKSFALLETIYIPTANELTPDGLMTEGKASRSFVSEILHQAQRWAVEHDDPRLAARVTHLACKLIAEELGWDDSGNATVDIRLLGVLRNAVSTYTACSLPLSDGESAPSWIFPEDMVRVRDGLAYSLDYEKFHPNEREARFILESFGLDPSVFLAAWAIGFGDPYPSTGWPIKENLRTLVAIEQQSPGISKRLFEDRMVRGFARCSPAFWLYLDDPKPCIGNKRCAAIFSATYDHNNAFRRPRASDRILQEITDAGDYLEYYECASLDERVECERRLKDRNPTIFSILDQYHSAGTAGVLGDSRSSSGWYTVEDIRNQEEWIQQLYETVGSVAILGCSTGIDDGIAATLAAVIGDGKWVYGLGYPARASYTYTKDRGFRLFSTEDRKGAAHNRGGRASIGDRHETYIDSAVTLHRRLSPEAEIAMSTFRESHISMGL